MVKWLIAKRIDDYGFAKFERQIPENRTFEQEFGEPLLLSIDS